MTQTGTHSGTANYAAKEWGTLMAWSINPSAISYEPKINSMKVQGDWNRAGSGVATGEQEGEEMKARRAQRDRQRCLMSHRRMYSSMASGNGAPPLSLTC